MDILTNKEKIEAKIQVIEEFVDRLPQAAEEKACTMADYEKAIAVTILKLKNGAIQEFEGNKVGNLPANLIPVVAKGICYKESFDKEMGEANYKGMIVQIDAHKAVLNGFQSLNKVIQ